MNAQNASTKTRLSPARRAAIAEYVGVWLLDGCNSTLESSLLDQGVIKADDTIEAVQVVRDDTGICGIRVLAETYKCNHLVDAWVPFALFVDTRGQVYKLKAV
jgi:hypothetical protein